MRAVEPDFNRVITIVVVVGLLIGGTGATVLYLAFRAFDENQPKQKPVIILGALILFILVVGAVLFFFSKQG